jgi:F-type H+-transporting ATPase subunit b
MFLEGTAGVIDINGTVWVELLTFVVMFGVLARYVYPVIVKQAEARQRAIAEQLAQAEKSRADAEAHLKDAQAKLDDARKTAQGVIDAAGKSAEQLRAEMKDKAEAEAKRIAESARKEIEAERDRAIQSVRGEVANLVVTATEKVIGDTLDVTKHKQLIDRAIEEVASGDGSR